MPGVTNDGLVTVGDSLVNAGRSWAFLLAESGGWPLTRYSAGGVTSTMVLEQLPLLAGKRYAVGALSVGANDVLSGWSAPTFEANLSTILVAMTEACDRVLVQTLHSVLGGVPGAPSVLRGRVIEANRIIVSVAAGHPSCTVVDATDLAGRRLMSPDRVHQTDAGQAVIARRCAQALGVTLHPSPTVGLDVTFSPARYANDTFWSSARVMAKRALRR